MFEAIKQLLSGQTTQPGAAGRSSSPAADPEHAQRDQLQIAACVLLLELAYADDYFAPQERARIEQALSQHFDLSPDDARRLMEIADARRRDSVELYQFTTELKRAYDEGQRLLLAEIMWRVVEADGTITEHEQFLMRKLGYLLDLKPGYLSQARERASQSNPQHPQPD